MKTFSILLAILAIAELIGFISGRSHCIYAAILIGALSAFIWWQGKKDQYIYSDLPKERRRNMKRI